MPTDMRINGRKRIIHDYNIGIEVDRSSNVETLFLTTGNCNATFSDLSEI